MENNEINENVNENIGGTAQGVPQGQSSATESVPQGQSSATESVPQGQSSATESVPQGQPVVTAQGWDYGPVYHKIAVYRNSSRDVAFHQYLDSVLRLAESGTRAPGELMANLDVNYERYLSFANSHPVEPAKEARSNKTEYKIGVGVLSVVGSLFILSAVIWFGNYYLQDAFQGVLLYAISAGIVAVSETVIKKKLPKLTEVLTATGLCALYATNLFCLHNMKLYQTLPAVIATIAISAIAWVLGQKRENGLIEIITSLGCFTMCIGHDFSVEGEYITVAIMVILVGAIFSFAHNKKVYYGIEITRISILFLAGLVLCSHNSIKEVPTGIFVATAIALLAVMYANSAIAKQLSTKIVAGSEGFVLLVAASKYKVSDGWPYFAVLAGAFAVCALTFFAMRERKHKMIPYLSFMVYALGLLNGLSDKVVIEVLVLAAIVIISTAISRWPEFDIADCVITTIACLYMIGVANEPLSMIVMAVVLIGPFITTRTKLYQEILVLCVFPIYVLFALDGFIVTTSILVWEFVLIYLYNHVKGMKVKGIEGANITGLSIMGLTAMLGVWYNYDTQWQLAIVLAAALIIGVGAIIVVISPEYGLSCRGKYIIMGIYLTYMAFALRIENLWISIVLMVIALLLIALGCKFNRFEVRVYGLCLALCDCVKVAIYDYHDAESVQKMVVFLIVGILAIMISIVYMMLEKHEKSLRSAEEAQMAAAGNGFAGVQAVAGQQAMAGQQAVAGQQAMAGQQVVAGQPLMSGQQEVVIPQENEVKPEVAVQSETAEQQSVEGQQEVNGQ